MEALTMESQMDNWNDDRLDELSRGMKEGFAKVDSRFERVEGEMKEGFAQVDNRFERVEGEMKEGFARVDRRFERVEGEMKEGFARVDKEMKEGFANLATSSATKAELGAVNGELRRLNERFDRLLHALMVAGIGFGITMLASLAGFFATQL